MVKQPKRSLAPLFLSLLALDAGAYCVENKTKDRDVFVEQSLVGVEQTREDRIFRHTLKPGQKQCCFNLDCNPGGRPESTTTLSVRVLGDPVYLCGTAENVDTIKVTGNGTVRVGHNPRPKSAFPYSIHIRTNDREVFGPNGLQCLPPKKKAQP